MEIKQTCVQSDISTDIRLANKYKKIALLERLLMVFGFKNVFTS
jgi:hypothetical protein